MRPSLLIAISASSLVSASFLESAYFESQPGALFSRGMTVVEGVSSVDGLKIKRESSKSPHEVRSEMESEPKMKEEASKSSSEIPYQMGSGSKMKEETSKSLSEMPYQMGSGSKMKEETSKSSSEMPYQMGSGSNMKEETSKSSSEMPYQMGSGSKMKEETSKSSSEMPYQMGSGSKMKEETSKSSSEMPYQMGSGSKMAEGTSTEKSKQPTNVKEGEMPAVEREVIVVWVNEGGDAKTKTMNPMAEAPAATHNVVVGGPAGLLFVPDEIKANVGDMVVFQFLANNHTATQSSFKEPCKALPDGMDTGFMPNVNNSVVPAPQVAMQVKVTTPIWFYCKQKSHCGKGMTFSINPGPPGSGKTQLDFKESAIKEGNQPLPPILGGAPLPSSMAPPMASPMAPPMAPPSAAPPSVVPGTGKDNGGVCSCSCVCGIASFPNMATQGIGSYGGMPGALPMSAMAV